MNSLLCKQCIRKCCSARGVYPSGRSCPNWLPIDELKPVVEENAAVRMAKARVRVPDGGVDGLTVANAINQLTDKAPVWEPMSTPRRNCESCSCWNRLKREGDWCSAHVSSLDNSYESYEISMWFFQNTALSGFDRVVRPNADNCPGWQAKTEPLKWCTTCGNNYDVTRCKLIDVNTNVQKWAFDNTHSNYKTYEVVLNDDCKSSCPGWKERE